MLGKRPVFPHLSVGRRIRFVGAGVRKSTPGRRTGPRTGTRRGPSDRRVAVSSFVGISLEITRIVRTRPIGGTSGLLGLRLSLNCRGHRIISKVTGFCGPRSLINEGIVYIAGLGPIGLHNRLSRKVVLTKKGSKRLSLTAVTRSLPLNTEMGWCC